ncbi:MAG: hypothetical protein ACYTG6_12190 [Planctomycetota bacterium]|jgi:hypothetical protein
MSRSTPPPSREPERAPDAWAALEALAAGELPAAEADVLRIRIRTDPVVAARYARVVAVEEALAAEDLLAVPPHVVEGVLAALPRGRRLVLQPLARMAAAVVLAFAAWLTSGGAAPTLAAAAPADVVGKTLEPAIRLVPLPRVQEPHAALAEAGVATESASPLALGVVGALVLVAGLFLARRLSRGGGPRRESS